LEFLIFQIWEKPDLAEKFQHTVLETIQKTKDPVRIWNFKSLNLGLKFNVNMIQAQKHQNWSKFHLIMRAAKKPKNSKKHWKTKVFAFESNFEPTKFTWLSYIRNSLAWKGEKKSIQRFLRRIYQSSSGILQLSIGIKKSFSEI
jgi:hypothetical protein